MSDPHTNSPHTDYLQMVEDMPADVYQHLARAVETGKWPDGRTLTADQKHNALQAVIAWGELHLKPEERVGFIDRGRKAGETCDDPDTQTLNWRENTSDG